LNGGTLITAGMIAGGTGTTAGDAVQFGPSDGSMVVEPGAVFESAIGGFTIGDVIDVSNLTPAEVSADLHGDTLSMGGDGTLAFTGIPARDLFVFSNYGAGGTQITLAEGPCFRRGTRILAERGEVPVESLRIGDRVMTMTGITRPICWIGRRSHSGERASGDSAVLPILIRAGALADQLPRRDLWVSPEHAMYVDGMLIPAAALVNGVSILQEEWVEDLSYFHLEFDTHEVIYAEGALSESFVDDESRQMFDNAAEYARLYPNTERVLARFCAPRVEDGEELEAVRRRLAARAERLAAESAVSITYRAKDVAHAMSPTSHI
jgi:O-antigen biosynthesis protein